MTRVLTREEARAHLVAHLGLARPVGRGPAGVRATLARLRCVQLDPLDVIGTNADLVMMARVDGIGRGDVHRATLPGHAFEHFAKERCLLPAYAFPHYRDQAVETPWWRLTERLKRVPPAVLDAVEHEVRERGPVSAAELTDHGRVEPLDWQGWQGTARMTTMALEVLWTRCRVVVAGRTARGEKRYDTPARALPAHHDAPATQDFARWALLERVAAAGLLARAGGPHWSMLRAARTSSLPDRLVEEGLLEDVIVEGSSRRYLALRAPPPRVRDDGRLRILGPLDPLLWDRTLVAHAFGFDYAWEVYKPAAARRWGWYVCPLLHEGRLVGRLEARVRDGALVVERLWPEQTLAGNGLAGNGLDEDALDAALARHAEACGVDLVRRDDRPQGRQTLPGRGKRLRPPR